MIKQSVIVESPGKIMGKDWQLWRDGINEAILNQSVNERVFNDPADQRAYDKLRTQICKQKPFLQ